MKKVIDYKEKKELDKRISRKIETTNPYVMRKELQPKLENGPVEVIIDDTNLSFTGVKIGHNSSAATDPQFLLDEKPQTGERPRKTRAHRMSIQAESDKSDKQQKEYLKSLLNDEVA
jgi:hypothetical protein